MYIITMGEKTSVQIEKTTLKKLTQKKLEYCVVIGKNISINDYLLELLK